MMAVPPKIYFLHSFICIFFLQIGLLVQDDLAVVDVMLLLLIVFKVFAKCLDMT